MSWNILVTHCNVHRQTVRWSLPRPPNEVLLTKVEFEALLGPVNQKAVCVSRGLLLLVVFSLGMMKIMLEYLGWSRSDPILGSPTGLKSHDR